jgi:hypothetical protein
MKTTPPPRGLAREEKFRQAWARLTPQGVEGGAGALWSRAYFALARKNTTAEQLLAAAARSGTPDSLSLPEAIGLAKQDPAWRQRLGLPSSEVRYLAKNAASREKSVATLVEALGSLRMGLLQGASAQSLARELSTVSEQVGFLADGELEGNSAAALADTPAFGQLIDALKTLEAMRADGTLEGVKQTAQAARIPWVDFDFERIRKRLDWFFRPDPAAVDRLFR